jgi:hypothetical protein
MLLKTTTPYVLSIAQTRYEADASHETGISIIITCSVETKVLCVNHIPWVWDPQCLLFMQIIFIFYITVHDVYPQTYSLLQYNDPYKHNTR